jgi:hypothetical protein
VPLVLHFRARNAKRLSQPDPHLDSAGARLRSIVVDNPLQPHTANLGVGTVGENRSVLARDRALIRKSVGNPALELSLRELAFVHQLVKRMIRVVGATEGAESLG